MCKLVVSVFALGAFFVAEGYVRGQNTGTPYNLPVRGGLNLEIFSGAASLLTGSVRMQATAGALPAGTALFTLRQDGVLISETAVPAAPRFTSGRVYAELSLRRRTGVAMANPNNEAAVVGFSFADAAGESAGSGTLTIPPNSQIARFLDEAPFKGMEGMTGSLTMISNLPVATTALLGLINERSEFLVTTLPVADLSSTRSTAVILPHFAYGGGWSTRLILVNPTESVLSGTIGFYDEKGSLLPSSRTYLVPPRTSRTVELSDSGSAFQVGWIRIHPGSGNDAPEASATFSFRTTGVTTTEAGVPAAKSGKVFQLAAEALGWLSQAEAGSVRTGVAVANPGTVPASLNFELTTMTGAPAGSSGSMTLPPNGHVSLFIDQLPGLQSMRIPFKGVLRISTSSAEGIAVTGLKGRWNERREFLISATPVFGENEPAAQVFPHIAFGGGYTTTLVLLSALSASANVSGILNGYTVSGQTLVLPGAGSSNPQSMGPWNFDLELYESDDGLRFIKSGLFSERGGVPTMARLRDGRLLAMFQWFPIDRRESFDQIAATIGSPDGNTWSAPRTIQINGMPETLYRSFDPTLVVLPDGRLRLYFSSERGTAQNRRGNRAIFSAISTDGFTFTFEPGQRFGLEDTETFDPAVALLGPTWHLYCPISGQKRGYHATSEDGLTFTRQSEVSVEGQREWLGNVLAVPGGLRFYGSGPGGWVGYSSDGFHWTVVPSQNPPAPDPGVVLTDSGRTLGIALGPRRPDATTQSPFPN